MTTSIKEALEPVLSFLDELAANAVSGKRQALNPIVIGGSAKLYAEGLRAALATFQPDGERREAIARALAEKWPGDYMQGDDECEREPNALAYEVADVALSSVGLSSAAICALEESRSLVEWLLEGRELDDMDQIRIGKWSAACQKADALATFQPDGERREAIARITFEHEWERPWSDAQPYERDHHLSGADKLLASGLVQNEAAIRRDEREKCAKIADREAEFWQDAESSSARIVAANIRSARDGGAET